MKNGLTKNLRQTGRGKNDEDKRTNKAAPIAPPETGLKPSDKGKGQPSGEKAERREKTVNANVPNLSRIIGSITT